MKQQMDAMTQQQHLINQYMQLNIHLLNQKLDNLQKNPIQDKPKIPTTKEQCNEQFKNTDKKNKKINKVNKCGHEDKQHYAKGLCNNCYHKYGRTKKPWNCHHEKLYAAGMCQNCYINNYNRKKCQTKDSNNQIPKEEQQDIETEIKQNNLINPEQKQFQTHKNS